MKIKSTPILLAGLFLSMAFDVIAASANEQLLTQKLQQIAKQADQLQKEMNLLKAELRELKQAKAQEKIKTPAVAVADKPSQPPATTPGINILLPITVLTSPYAAGFRTSFDASDLTVNVPTMGEDLFLLRDRESIRKTLGGLPYHGNRPIVVVSGKIEPYVYFRNTYPDEFGFKRKESDIDLNTMELDFLIHASSWALGYISINYDSSFLDTSLVESPVGSRIANSRIFLKRGFVTIGNLQKFPFYLSAGQMYLNFGRYGSALVTPSLPQILGQTNQRQIQIGYAKEDGFSASAYVFHGDAHTSEFNPNQINEGGGNLRYIKDLGKERSISIGVGYITNIANADGVQITNLPYPRLGFASLAALGDEGFLANELLSRRAAAMNIHTEYAFGPWTVLFEYVGTVHPFSFDNMGFNAAGASPKALHSELNRKFSILDKPANLSVAFGRSWQALAVGLPTQKYSCVFNVSPVKNTILSFEFSHFKNYLPGITAFIKGSDVPLIFPIAPFVSTGSSSNLFLVQWGLYF